MKNSLFLLGAAAVAALSSCSQSEVMEVAENRAIGFNAFVNNNTRAITELTKTNLIKFNVFGYHGTNTPDYTNTLVTGSGITNEWTISGAAYWQKDNAYEFAAYSDGNNSLANENVSFAEKKLTISNYTVSTNDLIAAQTSVASQNDITKYVDVNLNFYHLLSQVKFTFSNSDSRDYIMKISDLTITANKTGKVVFTMNDGTSPSITWSDATTGTYTITGLADIAEGDLNAPRSTESILVMPQENDALTVSFKVTLSDKNGESGKIAEGDFTAPLDIDAEAQNSAWQPGYRYNYTATINGDQVPDIDDPDKKPIKIEFTVTKEIDGWENAEADPTTPSVVVTPEP